MKAKPFHVRLGKFGRAFVDPGNFWRRLYLRWRGYRPHWIGPYWSKPSKNSRAITFDETTLSLSEWCDLLSLDYGAAYLRLLRGELFSVIIHE